MKDEDKLLFLRCLEDAGVESWEGYETAVDEYTKIRYGDQLESLEEALVIALEEDDYA